MKLIELQISNLRNIRSLNLPLHPHINVIVGMNGSGKTSFLEALYLLSTGHSFRSREISSLVAHGQSALTVFAKTMDSQKVSIQKAINLPTIARINSQPCLSSSELASFLPCQVFYQDIFQLIDAGPAVRRGMLDWGMFHVEHNYLGLLKDYRRALKQRNALLRQRAKAQQLVPWDNQITELSNSLHSLRINYCQDLNAEFIKTLAQLTDINCELLYYKGWDRKEEGKNLDSILKANYESDLTRQYTHYGAHQADLLVVSKDFKVKHFLSRGQQKIILFALKFSQAKLLNKPCIYLIDDMTSELDDEHAKRLINYIADLDGQFFLTMRSGEPMCDYLAKYKSKTIPLTQGQLIV